MEIDVNYDVRSDIRPGSDPDKYSKTLKRFHKALWSKELPSGKFFNLTDSQPNVYLYHQSDLGEFCLSSDGIAHSLYYVKRVEHVIKQVGEDKISEILRLFYTVPGFTLFPGNQINRKVTINAARGFNARICDRFDLTLECIRRFYLSIDSPLGEVFRRYQDFFSLFESFEGYCDYFLLQDLWDSSANKVKFFLPFNDSFPTQPLPKNVTQYLTFVDNQSDFLRGRAERMAKYNVI
nr:hypothetical protein 3 [Alphaproteobacteria bacterium]